MVTGQRLALKLWRRRRLERYLFQMRWASDEPYENKQRRLLRLIDRLHGEGKQVSLVGASAGASAAVNAFAARPETIAGIVCICGKLAHPETISAETYRRNPPFERSMELLPANLERLGPAGRSRILSLKPLADESVPPADTYVADARTGTLPMYGHVTGIAYALTLGSGRIIRFLRRQTPPAAK